MGRRLEGGARLGGWATGGGRGCSGGGAEAESGGAGSRSAVATPSSPLEGGRTGAAVGGEGCRRLLNTDTDDYGDADAVRVGRVAGSPGSRGGKK